MDDLLGMARIAHAKLEIQCVPTWLDAIVDDAIELLGPELSARDQRVIVRRDTVDETSVVLNADHGRLIQVLSNLPHNAAKFSDFGDLITLALAADTESVSISVIDTGIGLEPGKTDAMFSAFEQGKQALDRSRSSLGLGLVIVKDLVELHGRVSAHSEGPGNG